jgi:hypothetical protein
MNNYQFYIPDSNGNSFVGRTKTTFSPCSKMVDVPKK